MERASKGNNLCLEDEAFLKNEGFLREVVLLSGAKLDFCFGLVIDHEKGVEVQLVAFVSLSFSAQSSYLYRELAQIVVKTSIVAEFNPSMFFDQHDFVLLTLLISDFHLEVLKALVADDKKRHYGAFHLSSSLTLMDVRLVQFSASWMLALQVFVDAH